MTLFLSGTLIETKGMKHFSAPYCFLQCSQSSGGMLYLLKLVVDIIMEQSLSLGVVRDRQGRFEEMWENNREVERMSPLTLENLTHNSHLNLSIDR